MKMERDKAEESLVGILFGVLEPVGEPLLGEVVDGNMIVPEPWGFFTFFNRRGMFRLLSCSIVKG
jgi:hypothetical protein